MTAEDDGTVTSLSVLRSRVTFQRVDYHRTNVGDRSAIYAQPALFAYVINVASGSLINSGELLMGRGYAVLHIFYEQVRDEFGIEVFEVGIPFSIDGVFQPGQFLVSLFLFKVEVRAPPLHFHSDCLQSCEVSSQFSSIVGHVSFVCVESVTELLALFMVWAG